MRSIWENSNIIKYINKLAQFMLANFPDRGRKISIKIKQITCFLWIRTNFEISVSYIFMVLLTFDLQMSSADNLRTVSTQIRPNKTSGLIWIQTVWHSDGKLEINFPKFDFGQKLIRPQKGMQNDSVGRVKKKIQYLRYRCKVTPRGPTSKTVFT